MWMARQRRGVVAGIGAIAVLTACMPSPLLSPTPAESAQASEIASAGDAVVVLAAGDVGACDSNGDEATAALLDELDGTILALGDLAYPDGTAKDFAKCYDPSWGRHADRSRPVPGNHEYETDGATAYFDYFGDAAGDPGEGWYAFDIGSWHLIAMNSNCGAVGGCNEGSDQTTWLQDQLPGLSPPHGCTLAYWHHPRWSSGHEHGSSAATDVFWQLLYDAGADVVLTAHDHQYERFVPLDSSGAADPDGMVEFVVGTGGKSLYEFDEILPTSAAHDNSSYGVLKLTLLPSAYDWEFVPTSDTAFEDSGSATCR
jgi:Calcineurin-like phosphoesterase